MFVLHNNNLFFFLIKAANKTQNQDYSSTHFIKFHKPLVFQKNYKTSVSICQIWFKLLQARAKISAVFVLSFTRKCSSKVWERGFQHHTNLNKGMIVVIKNIHWIFPGHSQTCSHTCDMIITTMKDKTNRPLINNCGKKIFFVLCIQCDNYFSKMTFPLNYFESCAITSNVFTEFTVTVKEL